MMKIKFFLSVMFASIILSGCSLKTSSKLTYDSIDKEKIVETSVGIYDYEVYYPDITSLAESSEAVVYAEVMDVEYIPGENGLCRTKEKIKVLQSIKGEFTDESIVNVLKEQGILSLKEYIDSFESEDARKLNREDFKEYSDDELDDLYIQQIAQNDIMSEKGQKGIYFLEKSAFYGKDKTYVRLTGAEGEFLEAAEDQFAKVSEISMSSQETAMYEMEDEETNVSEYNVYTLNEIISAMEE